VWRGDASFKIVESIAARENLLRIVIAEQPCGIPQLRRDAVRAARAPRIAITEDHCLFPDDWLAGMTSPDDDVRGGGVSNGLRSYTGWAQYFTRYHAFLPPVGKGATRHLPGNSASYPRRAFELSSIDDGFWEAEFNGDLLRKGVRFFSDPALTVEQRQRRGWLEFALLRYQHGRCYGGRREGSKLRLLVLAPLIPLVLLLRMARAAARKPGYRGRFAVALPLIAFYVLAWSAGEIAGYICGAGESSGKTD
jgi:hypothetical protein